MTNQEAFLKFRDNLIKAIIANPDYKKAKAFGNFEDFIKSAQSYNVSNTKFTQFGTNYTIEIDKGRGKNKINSGGLLGAIYEWLELKKYGINYSDDKERESIAYAITKTIAKKGSFKHRNKSKRTQIIDSSIRKTLPGLLADLTKVQVEEKTKQIVSIWQLT